MGVARDTLEKERALALVASLWHRVVVVIVGRETAFARPLMADLPDIVVKRVVIGSSMSSSAGV